MRVLGLAFAVLLAVTVPTAAHANWPLSKMRPANSGPAPGIVLVWDGGGSGRHSGAFGGHFRHRNGGWLPRIGGRTVIMEGGVPTYWVYVPGSAVFDYPFADWRGPTGGWGNP